MEECMMKPEVKKKPVKPKPPPKPPEKLSDVQYRVKRMEKQINETSGNVKQRETPVIPPRPTEKELNSATRYSQRRRAQAEDAESIREADQQQNTELPKDDTDIKQSNQSFLTGIFRRSQKEGTPTFSSYITDDMEEKKKTDDDAVQPAPSSKPGILKGVMKGLQFKSSQKTSGELSVDSTAEEAGSVEEQSEEKNNDEKSAKPKQEKGGFFSGIVKKSNKPADDTSSQDNLSVHSELSVGSDSLSENKGKKRLFGGVFKKSPKPAEDSQTDHDQQCLLGELSGSNDDLPEAQKKEKGLFSGFLRKSKQISDQDEKSQPEVPDDDESLSENNGTKEKMRLFGGVFKKSPKPAEASQSDQGHQSLPGELSSSNDDLTEAQTKEKGLFSGFLHKSKKRIDQDEKSQTEVPDDDESLSENNGTKEKGGVFGSVFKKSPKLSEAPRLEEGSEPLHGELAVSSDSLSENKEKGGLFSGLIKKPKKTAGEEEGAGLLSGFPKKSLKAAGETKDSPYREAQELLVSKKEPSNNNSTKEKNIFSKVFQKLHETAEGTTEEKESELNTDEQLCGNGENQTDTDAPKEKKGGLAGFFKRPASIENLFEEKGLFSGHHKKTPKTAGDEEAAEDKDSQKPLFSSDESLAESDNVKEKTGGFKGIFKKSSKPAPRTVTTQDPLTKQLSTSWDSVMEVGKEDVPPPSELSASYDNLLDATDATQEKKVGFFERFKRTPKSEQQQECENTEASEGGRLRRRRTIKKKRRIVSFRLRRTFPKIPKPNLVSQDSEKMPAIEEEIVELQDITPAQEVDELLEWFSSVLGWSEWNETSNFQEDEEETAMEQAADRVYMAARLFVHLFNHRGASLQKRIFELLALADAADEFHKKTVSAAVGGSVASVAGSLATITGLILAPFTFGASIIVTAVGIGVATAGSITSATANITDTVHSSMDRKKVEKMIQDYQDEIEDIRKCMEFVQEGMDTLQEWDFEKYAQSAAKKALNRNIKHVMKEGGRAGKALMINTDKLINTVKVLGAAGGVAKAARAISVTTGVMSALFLALDIFFLAKESRELHKGAKTKFAAKIREVCTELQNGLLELNKVKTQLQKTMDGVEVEEYEEIEEVEEEVEDEFESDPKKLAELEQELDLLEEKLDKKLEDGQKKNKEMEKEKSKIKKEKKEEKSMKEKEEKNLEDKEKTEENNSKKKEKKKKVEGESKLDTTPDEIKELKKETSIKTSKEEVLKEQPLKGSKKEKETENQITAGKEQHESKQDKMKSVTNKTAEKEKSKMGGEQDEVKSRSGEDRSQTVKPERESEKRRRSSREDDGGMKPEIKPVNKEKAGESGKTRRHSSRSDKDEERGGKHVTRETEEERGSHHKRRECDDGGVKDWRAEMVKSREEKREDRGSERRRESHQSHEYLYHDSTRSRKHSERELGSNREGSKRSHYRSELEERGDEKPVSRVESARREFERAGVQWEVEEGSSQKREDGGSQRRSSNRGREHEHSRRGSQTHSSALLKDGLDI
ncbi:uncharacterized protein KZ484_020930 isoform 2-T2 [Pholidichthys leucotaenia]